LFVAFYGAGIGADGLGPCVSKHPRNRLAAVRMSLGTAFSIAAVVLSTGVLLIWARGTTEILVGLVAYLTLVYANTVGLRFKHKRTCH
jgi:hypothetical protein